MSEPFNAADAVLYGSFVEAAYGMYQSANGSLTPAPSGLPAGYELAARIQMQDLLFGSTGPVFYGILAQSTSDPTSFVLAIRGTSSGVEWWDDANALLKAPFKVPGCGSVGSGFARIYDTLEVVERPTGLTPASTAVKSLRSVGGFSAQIASLVSRHAAASPHLPGVPKTATVAVAGHSLGAALATLYVLDNAKTDQISSLLCYTFASPRVGDDAFAAAFNGLALTSWRIVNVRDLVPELPPALFGFAHVDAEQRYDSSGKVQANVGGWHSLATYLALLDPTRLPDSNCALDAATPQFLGTSGRGTTLSIPSSAGGINININIGASPDTPAPNIAYNAGINNGRDALTSGNLAPVPRWPTSSEQVRDASDRFLSEARSALIQQVSTATSIIDPHRALVASTALGLFGMVTSGLPGTAGGIDACAAAVQLVLKSVFGHDFVAGGMNPAWVPDLRMGLLTGGWLAFDGAADALAGDIAIQNGQHDGTASNPYENHVGVVVVDRQGTGSLVVLSNSSSQDRFDYIDDLQFSNIGYPPGSGLMGPSRFYRYKPTA